jgi:hypothetical protein
MKTNQNTRTIVMGGMLAAMLALAGCTSEDQGPAEKAGEQIDEAMEEATDTAQDAAEEAGDALEEAADEAEDATD